MKKNLDREKQRKRKNPCLGKQNIKNKKLYKKTFTWSHLMKIRKIIGKSPLQMNQKRIKLVEHGKTWYTTTAASFFMLLMKKKPNPTWKIHETRQTFSILVVFTFFCETNVPFFFRFRELNCVSIARSEKCTCSAMIVWMYFARSWSWIALFSFVTSNFNRTLFLWNSNAFCC